MTAKNHDPSRTKKFFNLVAKAAAAPPYNTVLTVRFVFNNFHFSNVTRVTYNNKVS